MTGKVKDVSNTNSISINPATETVSQIVQNLIPSVVSIRAEGNAGSGTGYFHELLFH